MANSLPYSKGQLLYSLATKQSSKGPATMNIMGYACQVNMHPPKMALSLYNGTLSKENMIENKSGVLQVLGEELADLVVLLGTKSGRDTNKLEELRKMNIELEERWGITTIKNLVGAVHLKLLDVPVMELGDHGLFICEVTDHVFVDDNKKPLFRQRLTDLNILV
eukprot:TRINITY_DN8913_c1_g1_i1.p2 TRINITY_DN8913_c1_g1~~TRINITY_DN8913_c1_g1_i1.p2  ORF type:complete len:165 (+),score=16.89 TRINITY_DN8913_c1_g1_i1:82-576(+)